MYGLCGSSYNNEACCSIFLMISSLDCVDFCASIVISFGSFVSLEITNAINITQIVKIKNRMKLSFFILNNACSPLYLQFMSEVKRICYLHIYLFIDLIF